MIAHCLYSWPSFYNPHIKKKLELVGVLQVVRVYLFGGDRGSAAIFTAVSIQPEKREFFFSFYKLLSFFCIYLPAWFVVSPWPFRVKRREEEIWIYTLVSCFLIVFFFSFLSFFPPAAAVSVTWWFFSSSFQDCYFKKYTQKNILNMETIHFPVDDGP